MFLPIFDLSICYLLMVFIQIVISATPCIYDLENQKKLDIRPLGRPNGKGPKYDNIPNTIPTPITFSWNGCFSYSKPGSGNCIDAAACYTNSAGESTLIAKQNEVQFEYVADDVNVLVYHHNDILLTVVLRCRDADDDIVRGRQDDAKIYNLEVQSRCCCPGKCRYSEGSLSGGAVFIIILVVLLFVYIVGGMIFLKFFRGATGPDMIPNRLIWLNILSHAIDGFRYSIQVIRYRSFSVDYQKI